MTPRRRCRARRRASSRRRRGSRPARARRAAAAHAEPPALSVVRGAIRNELGSSGCVNTCSREFLERDDGVDRNAVVEDVEVRVGEVDDPRPVRRLRSRRSRMFHSLGRSSRAPAPRRRLDHLQRDLSPDQSKGLAKALAGDASADREHLHHPPVDRCTRRRGSGPRSSNAIVGSYVCDAIRASPGD